MKAFVITLKDNESSVRLSNNCIESLNVNGYEAHVFDAHCGEESSDFLLSHNVRPISDTTVPYFDLYNRWTTVVGTIGCFASHFDLWLKSISLNEPIIIMEHDAKILRPWNDFIWKDVLHLDWEGSIRRRHMRGTFDEYADGIQDSVFRMGFSPGEARGIVSMNCAYAYAIKPHAAEILVNDAVNNGWFAADRFTREPLVLIETIHPKVAEEQPEAVEMFTTSF
jgi:GR25 family glycosyltransferase involved in LPS biosynthesis